ncbi:MULTISPECIES: hypothetical protein [unclassified Paraburkholderia]|uniref:hypothetical protein n=1 Tax=unclassified Paraburkholderia TaxID=2615204 RepID=UPI002AB0A66F|nr:MULTISPECIES: hypothetical protein [unclassified Paraburkholderia]
MTTHTVARNSHCRSPVRKIPRQYIDYTYQPQFVGSMMRWTGKKLTMASVLLAGAVSAHTAENKPADLTDHVSPNGLHGWIERHSFADGQSYPTTLVIARGTRRIRQIEGAPFVWGWIFWQHGNLVAYKTGSLHFNMSCVLFDISSGRQLASLDCYHDVDDSAPAWEKSLLNENGR